MMTDRRFQTTRVFAVTLISIFLAEYGIMLNLDYYAASLHGTVHAVLDSTILVVMLFPILYGFIFRPLMLKSNAADERAEREENARKDSDERFRRITENAPDIILRWNLETGVEYANPALERLTGYTQDDVIGKMGFLASKLHPDDMPSFADVMQSLAFEKPQARAFEFRLFAKDGSIVWLDARFVPHWNDKGEILSAEIIARTITGRKKAEEALYEKERLLEESQKLAHVGSWEVDLKTHEAMWSDELYSIHGYEPGAVSPSYEFFLSTVHPDDRDRVFEMTQKAVVQGELFEDEFRVVRPDGSVRWVHATSALLKDEAGMPCRLWGAAQDITDRKTAEDALCLSEERFKVFMDNSPALACIKDEEFKYVLVNKPWEMFSGKAQSECEGKTDYDVWPEETARELQENEKEAFEKNKLLRFHEIVPSRDGKIIHGLTFKFPLGEFSGKRLMGSVCVDITKQVDAEQILKIQNSQLTVISETLKNYLEDGNLKEASARLLKNALKHTQSEYGFIGFLTENNTLRIVAHEGVKWDATHNREFYENAVETYRDVGFLEFHNFKNLFGAAITTGETVISNEPKTDARSGGLPPGHPALNAFLGVPVKKGATVVGMVGVANKPGGYAAEDKDGVRIIVQAAGVLFDDHRRWENEMALEQEKKKVTNKMTRLTSAIEQTADMILITDINGVIEYVNASFENLTGYSKSEALGKTPAILSSGQHDKAFYQNFWDTILSGEVYHGEFINKKKNGELYTAYKTVTPVCDENGVVTHFVSVDKDVTEKKREEENQEKLARLESVGVLAGGIAHDFNNILTAILGNVSFAKLSINTQSRTYGLLDEAEKASLRAKEIARQLLTFSKGGEPVKTITSVSQLVQDAACFALRGSRVKCACSIPGDLWLCNVDEGQISQVVQNIVLNAEQSMAEGGRIAVVCENVALSGDTAIPLKPGEYVRIFIQDEGEGIPEENLKRIFEPYFTTKKKGSGLGLATSYSIVKKHGGHIFVESEPGRGSAFHVVLPACKETTAKPAKKEKLLPVGKGRILVMDDEASIRALLRGLLEFLGYDAAFTKSGEETLSLYEQERGKGKPFDMIILDLTIPGGMGGKETIQRLLEINPRVKAIVSSGYADNQVMANYKQFGFKAVIAKPYDLKKMGEVLNDVMRMNGDGGKKPKQKDESEAS